MTPAGWIFMLTSFALISLLAGYCLFRTLGNGQDDGQL